jgi:NAD(P)-dependent dehydrogenase (short-subunit alcohol dehydrogenase family)
MNLTNKVALITGANGGLGMAVTTAFLEAGAQVAGVSPKIQDADFSHPNFKAFPGEIASGASAQAVCSAVVAKFGRIDVLVHLVGAFKGGKPIAETDDDTFRGMLDTNLVAAFYIVRAVLPDMRTRGSGRILAIGSKAAVEPVAKVGAYAASKAALVSLVRTVAIENKDRGITANIVLPGTMDTPGNRAAMPGADPSKWVHPSQVASMLVHLATDEASQISGAAIPVLGGEL